MATVKAAAPKRSIALQLQRLIGEPNVSKTELFTRMKTSRAALDRLLDAEHSSLTPAALEKVAQALGRRLRLESVPA